MNRNDIFFMWCVTWNLLKDIAKTVIAMAAIVCVAWLIAQIITEVCNG